MPIRSIEFLTPDGTYGPGDRIVIRVNATVSSTEGIGGGTATWQNNFPHTSLQLETGDVDRHATFALPGNTQTTVYYVDYAYTVQAGDFSADLDYKDATSLYWRHPTATYSFLATQAGNYYDCILPAPKTAGSLSYQSDIVVDGIRPNVTSVVAAVPDGPYGQGRDIRVNVTFGEPVVVNGTAAPPSLALNFDGTHRAAAYASGNNSDTLVFNYTVGAGDGAARLDYNATNALAGAITDIAGNPANLTLFAPGAPGSLAHSSALAVESVAPRIANVTSPDDNGTYGTGTVVNITVGFTEPVEFNPPGARPEIPLDTGSGEQRNAVCTPAAAASDELECAYTVVPGDDTADLGYGMGSSLVLGGGGAAARDAAGNALNTTLPDSPAAATLGGSKDIALDTAVPEVLRVTSPNASGTTYGRGDALRIEVVFDGTVWIDPEPADDDESVPALRLETGEIDRFARYADGSGTATLGFAYTVVAGDFTPDLNYTGAGALSLGTGRALVDEYGNREESPALPDPASTDSLGGRMDIAVRTEPTVESVGANYTAGTVLKVGKTVGIRVQFSENVTVEAAPGGGGGVPYIELDTGRVGAEARAAYSSGSGTPALAFSYPVHPDDDKDMLDYSGTGALKANGAALRGAGSPANLTLPDPASGGSLASAGIALRPNEAPSIDPPLPNRTVGAGVELEVDVAATDPEGQPVTFSLAGDAPAGAEIDARTGLFTWTPTEAQRTALGAVNSTYAITVRASDPHAANDTARFAVTVVEAPPSGYAGPAVAAIPPAEGREGVEIRFDISVADARHGPYVYSLAADAVPPPPRGAAVHPTNGTFTWTPGYDQNGTHAITARVADRFALNATQAFTVAVADAEPPWNTPPAIEPVDPRSAAEGETLVVNISATDLDVPIAYSLPGDPPDGAAIDPATGVFTWDIGYDAAGTHNITVSAADRYNRTSSLSFAVMVADREEPNLPPAIAPIPAQRATAGTALEVQVNATDPNAGDTLAFGLSGPRPPGAAITAGGLFTWTPGRDQIGRHTLNVTVADGGGLSDWAPLAVTVDDLPVAAASAEAVFAGPRAVRIDYTAPLGPPAGHEGDVYGNVTIAGGGSADVVSVSGLGTSTHIVRLGGDAAAAATMSQNGTIRLLAGLEGVAGGALHTIAAGDIPVAAGETARTLSPPGDSPVAAIEPGGFVRALNATAAGDTARPAINVSGLAGAGAPPAPGGGITVTLPAGDRVAVIASFAEVQFPPGATAAGVPADGLLELYVAARAPTAQEVADGFDVDVADALEVRRAVEVGDNSTRIAFDLPVRILLVGQANGSAFYVHGADGTVVPITRECGADDADAVHAQLKGSGECQLDSADGGNKIVYTYHLTRFGTALVDLGYTCSATLSRPEIALGRIGEGGQSAAVAQAVVRAGTLSLASVSVNATAWTGAGGAEVMMPANATSVMAGGPAGAWTPLGGAPVALPVDSTGRSATAEFRVDVPRGALSDGASSPVEASQTVTYTVSCAAPPG